LETTGKGRIHVEPAEMSSIRQLWFVLSPRRMAQLLGAAGLLILISLVETTSLELPRALLQCGKKVVLLDNLSRAGTRDNLEWLRGAGSLEFVEGSTLNASLLREIILQHRPEVTYHLAGQVAMTTSLRDPWGDFQSNVVGTLNLLECLRLYLPETAVLYSSSNKVYGNLVAVPLVEGALRYEAPGFPSGLDETLPLDFRTPYGCSKGAADQYIFEYARTYGLRAAVFRHSTIYGVRQHSTFDQGWVGWFCLQALAQKKDPSVEPFTISGNGKQVRDLLHVEDAVHAYLLAAEKMNKISGQAFNIGGGMANSSSLLELFSELERLLEISLRFTRLDWRHEDQNFFVADITKIHAATSWHPVLAKRDGVSRTLQWLKEKVS